MGSMEVARQPCQARSHSLVERKKKKKKNHHHVDVHINQEGAIRHFFRFFGHPSEDSFFLSLFGFRGFFFSFVSLQCNRVSLAYASDAKEKKGSYVPFLFPIVYLFLN